MTASVWNAGARVTGISLSLFKDNGFYYSVDLTKAESSFYGKGAGCAFASGTSSQSR